MNISSQQPIQKMDWSLYPKLRLQVNLPAINTYQQEPNDDVQKVTTTSKQG